MLGHRSDPGYYTDHGASSLEDAFLCRAGRYCAEGTSATKVDAAECLPGFFCPLGTAASLNLDGTFGDDIQMRPPETLIEILKILVLQLEEDTEQYESEREDREQNITDAKESTRKILKAARAAPVQAIYTPAERQLVEEDELQIERNKATIKKQEWALHSHELRVGHLANRTEYLAEISIKTTCAEDEALPPELVEKYFDGGLNLACPRGTSSERGSWCLGHCAKPPA